METVRRISPQVRSAAKYDVSLSVLRRIAERGVVAKTGIMVGLGETEDEVLELMDDVLLALRTCGLIRRTVSILWEKSQEPHPRPDQPDPIVLENPGLRLPQSFEDSPL